MFPPKSSGTTVDDSVAANPESVEEASEPASDSPGASEANAPDEAEAEHLE